MASAFDVLNKLKWVGELSGCEIIIRHRGVPGDKRAIPGEAVTEVKKSYFVYIGERAEETVIPYHRVLEIQVKGRTVWEKGS